MLYDMQSDMLYNMLYTMIHNTLCNKMLVIYNMLENIPYNMLYIRVILLYVTNFRWGRLKWDKIHVWYTVCNIPYISNFEGSLSTAGLAYVM